MLKLCANVFLLSKSGLVIAQLSTRIQTWRQLSWFFTVHVNHLKYGHVKCVVDWPYSTFHRYVAKGIYPVDWCGEGEALVDGGA